MSTKPNAAEPSPLFTPGPWTWDQHGRLYAASVPWPLAERKGGALDSDARLIAAAPELVEALKEYAQNGHSVPTYRKCLAALAKTKGGA